MAQGPEPFLFNQCFCALLIQREAQLDMQQSKTGKCKWISQMKF